MKINLNYLIFFDIDKFMFKLEKKLTTTKLQKSPDYTKISQLPALKRKLVFEQHSINDIASKALFLNIIYLNIYFVYMNIIYFLNIQNILMMKKKWNTFKLPHLHLRSLRIIIH